MRLRHSLSAVELDEADWSRLDDAVEEFEKSCQTGAADMARFVPPANDPLRRQMLLELIKVDQ